MKFLVLLCLLIASASSDQQQNGVDQSGNLDSSKVSGPNNKLNAPIPNNCNKNKNNIGDNPVPDSKSYGNSGTDSIIACTKEWRPVCASNGKTYGNDCEFKRAQNLDSSLTMTKAGACSDGGNL